MAIESEAKLSIKPWVITADEQPEIDMLEATNKWLRELCDRTLLEQYRGRYVAARDCRIVASADTYDELSQLLQIKEPDESHVIACFKRVGTATCKTQ